MIFPCWERNVPTLGTLHSHVGNKVFPRWEYITSLGVEMVKRAWGRLSAYKELLLRNKARLLQHKARFSSIWFVENELRFGRDLVED